MRLLRPIEAAELLGVSRSLIYQLIKRGVVPAVRIGPRVVRVPQDELIEAIRSRRIGGGS